MTTLQKITTNIVSDIAVLLINTNSETTTLDIKNKLRQDGYWATQDEISSIMNQIYKSIGLTYSDNSGHRIYKKEIISSSTIPPSLSSSKKSLSKSLSKTPKTSPYGNPHVGTFLDYYQMRDGRIIKLTAIRSGGTKIWKVSGPCGDQFFESIHNRDEVRNAYSKIFSCKIQSTLASRI